MYWRHVHCLIYPRCRVINVSIKISHEDRVMQQDGQNNETIEYTTMINHLMTNDICENKPLFDNVSYVWYMNRTNI